MDWDDYCHRIKVLGINENYSEEEIDKLIAYAKPLSDKKLPIIFDQIHLSLLVGYKLEFLLMISNESEKFYRTFRIPKKNGGEREISEPLPSLKEIQRWILDEILNNCVVSGYSKAYKKRSSIKDNAYFHTKQPKVLTIDIKDFFPSITWMKVYLLFHNLGYSPSVSMMLSKLCCLNGYLPQGSPTSPYISNLIMRGIDNRIIGFIKNRNIHYTRYADDLSFSGDFPPGMIIKFVTLVLKQNKLEINPKKIRVRKPNQRQEVTGIVVNTKMQVAREMRRELRKDMYYITKFGLSSHLSKTNNQRPNTIKHLLGIANFIIFVNPEDSEAVEYRKRLHELLREE